MVSDMFRHPLENVPYSLEEFHYILETKLHRYFGLVILYSTLLPPVAKDPLRYYVHYWWIVREIEVTHRCIGAIFRNMVRTYPNSWNKDPALIHVFRRAISFLPEEERKQYQQRLLVGGSQRE